MPRPQDSQFSAPRPRTPAPHINPVFLWPTPENRDFLFFVERNGDLPQNQTWNFGDPYIDPITYPDHKLVFVTPQSPEAWSRWYYASDRIEQDEHNWTFSDADIGGTKFKSVTRLYVTPRADFDPLVPAMGAAMPDSPYEKFTETFILAGREQVQVDDEVIRSLYVLERRTYVKRVTVIDNEYNAELEQNLSTRQILYYRGETISGTPIETLVADEDNAYWGLTETTARFAKQLSDNWFLVTEQKVSVRIATDGTEYDEWPVKQIKSKGSEADIPALFADQVSSIQTITKLDLDAEDVEDIPDPERPSGTEARILHKKVSDLHYERDVLSKEFNLTGEIVKTDIEQRPYVRITQNTTGGLNSVVPAVGMGSSELIWKGGDQRLFANMDQDSVAKPGLKGFTKSLFAWGSMRERTDYSEDYADGEESRVIYDDGETRVYEVTNLDGITIDANAITKDKEPQQWGTLVWDGVYSELEDDSAERVKVVWSRGAFRVWLNETATIEVSGGTLDKDPQQWGTLTWTGTYSEILNGNADRHRQLWRMGDKVVYLNEVASISVSGGTRDKEPQQWGSLTWVGEYSEIENLNADRSRQIWRLGNNFVFLNETVDVEVSGGTLDKDPQPWGSLTWTGEYGDALDPGADRSRQIWRLGNFTVFLNETVSVEAGGTTLDKEPQQWGSLTWNGTYSDAQDGNSDRTRQVWRLGDVAVFLNEVATIEASGTTLDKDPQQWGWVLWNGEYSTLLNVNADRTRQVWRLGNTSVYLNEFATADVSGTTLDKELREWGNLRWEGEYATTTTGNEDRTRQIWRLGDQVVYLNETVSAENVGGTTRQVSPQQWGSLVWSGTFDTAASNAENDRVSQVFRIKDITIFQNETPSVVLASGSFVSYREENALVIETHTTSYGLSPISGTNTRSRIAFGLGTLRVYENTEITRTSKGMRSYAGMAMVDIPPELVSITPQVFARRDGDDSYSFDIQMTPGYRGPMPCTVEEEWQQNPGFAETITRFQPNTMEFSSPIGGFRIGECLHSAQSGSVVVGTQHPTYAFAQYSYSFAATNPATVPGSFIANVQSEGYLDGYIVRIFRVNLT